MKEILKERDDGGEIERGDDEGEIEGDDEGKIEREKG